MAAARAYVRALPGFQAYANQIYQTLHTDPHGEHRHGYSPRYAFERVTGGEHHASLAGHAGFTPISRGRGRSSSG